MPTNLTPRTKPSTTLNSRTKPAREVAELWSEDYQPWGDDKYPWQNENTVVENHQNFFSAESPPLTQENQQVLYQTFLL